MVSRRSLLAGGAALAAFAATGAAAGEAFAQAPKAAYAVTHSDSEWRKILTTDQYRILRHEATERPGSSPLLKEHRKGIFSCAGCKQDNFSSAAKFESGTGWPSFWQPLPNAVLAARDLSDGMDRTAVSCVRCGGHLGHVFDDGPKPTGLRYCMNGFALSFRPTLA
jgi:peptide-methionine (R)-S-oxide reductase